MIADREAQIEASKQRQEECREEQRLLKEAADLKQVSFLYPFFSSLYSSSTL